LKPHQPQSLREQRTHFMNGCVCKEQNHKHTDRTITPCGLNCKKACLKCNVDATMFQSNDIIGYGLCFRNSTGQFIIVKYVFSQWFYFFSRYWLWFVTIFCFECACVYLYSTDTSNQSCVWCPTPTYVITFDYVIFSDYYQCQCLVRCPCQRFVGVCVLSCSSCQCFVGVCVCVYA